MDRPVSAREALEQDQLTKEQREKKEAATHCEGVRYLLGNFTALQNHCREYGWNPRSSRISFLIGLPSVDALRGRRIDPDKDQIWICNTFFHMPAHVQHQLEMMIKERMEPGVPGQKMRQWGLC